MKTIYKSDDFMVDTPAAINRRDKILYINPKIFNTLTRFQRKFVLHHEFGHYMLKTANEFKADAYAFDKMAGTEFRSLKQCIECLQEILDKDNPEHRARIDALYQRAIQWDIDHGTTPTIKSKNNIIVDKFVSQSERTINAITDLLVQNTTAMNSTKVIENNASQTSSNTTIIAVLALCVLFIFYKSLFSD